MYKLFSLAPPKGAGQFIYNDTLYLKRNYPKVLEHLKLYYRLKPAPVMSPNPIVNIIKHIHIRPDLDDRAYYYFVQSQADALNKVFGFVSSISKGKVFDKGVTLGAPEIILSVDEAVDYDLLKRKWWEQPSFVYLYHTSMDLGMPMMNNQKRILGYGVAKLNIPLMMLQYRYWLKYMAEKRNGVMPTINYYVGSIVLPNAISSFHDIAAYNVLAAMSIGQKVPSTFSKHPIAIPDYSRRILSLSRDVIRHYAGMNETLSNLAQGIPSIFHNSLRDIIKETDGLVTRQDEWALALARMPYLIFLIRNMLDGRCDATEMTRIKVSIEELRSDNIASTITNSVIKKTFVLLANTLYDLVSGAKP